MKAIYKRELKAYFTSVIGWIFLAAFLFVFDLYFWAYNLSIGYAYIAYPLSSSVFIFLIIIPILSMRIMADDRRTKTDQLLYTAPVSIPRVIFGKYLAMLTIFSIAMAFVCVCPLIMTNFGDVPMGESYTAILGIWLFGVLCLAIGLFLSSVTESQVIAAILSFAVLFLGYMINSIVNTVFSSENIVTKALSCLAIASPLDNFLDGVLDVTGIIYYVTGAALFLFLTCQLVQKYRWSVSSKKIARGLFNSAFVVIGIAIVVVVNVLAAQLPESIQNIDVTGQKLYTLTDDTYTVLDSLDEEVTLYVLEDEDDADSILSKTLDRYAEGSDYITVEYVDPTVSPNFYTTYTDESPTSNSVIVVCGERSKVVDYGDIYEYSINYSTYTTSVSAYDGEGQLTSAILYVTNGDMETVYEITGHGETELDSTFTDALEKMNLSVDSLTLLTVDEVPEDAAAIVINGPTSDFSADDAEKVLVYLANGGKLLVTSSYEATGDMSNFDSILAAYGLTVTQGVIMEGDSYYCYQYPFYLLPDVLSADQTASVDGYVMILYAQAASYDETLAAEYADLLASYVTADDEETSDTEDADTDTDETDTSDTEDADTEDTSDTDDAADTDTEDTEETDSTESEDTDTEDTEEAETDTEDTDTADTEDDTEDADTDSEEADDSDDSEEEEEESTLSFTSFLETSSSAYLKTDIENMTTYEQEDGDEQGTFTLGAYVTDSETGGEIVLVTSVFAFNDSVDSYVSGQNLALFKSIVSDYSDAEVSVSIDSKEVTYSTLSVNSGIAAAGMVLLVVVVPVVLILAGVFIWLRRRKA